jgi:hypothetical protein
VPKQSNVGRTADIAPVRLENGRMVIRQCRANLHEEQATSRNITEFNRKTVGDILERLQKNRQIYTIVRGDK